MNQRERFLAAIRREKPDKVPKYAEFTPRQLKRLKTETGCDSPTEYFNYEMRAVYFKPTHQQPDYSRYLGELPHGSTITQWGVGEVPGSQYHFTKMVHPLRNITSAKEIESFPFPDYETAYRHQNLQAEIQAVHDRGLAAVSRFTMIFEHAWYLRGMVNLMFDFIERPKLAEALLDRITNIACLIHKRFAEAGVDLIRTGDDIGTQNGMLMSPAMWRHWLKPRLSRIIAAAKNANSDVKVLYDSDGNFDPVIPDLIEVGVDVLAPIQPECNDPLWLKQEYGEHLAFWGSLGVQTTIPFGSSEQVKQEVHQRIQTIGKGGGLVIAPSHVIPPKHHGKTYCRSSKLLKSLNIKNLSR